MIYTEFQPDERLKDYVKSYWWFDNSSVKQLDFTILPDGCFDLIVEFKHGQQTGISLTGLWTKQVDVSIEPDVQLFGIRFKLPAVDTLLKRHIADILDDELQLSTNFWQIDQLSFSDLSAVTKGLNTVLLTLLQDQKNNDTRKKKLFQLLYETNGGLTIQNYSQQVCWESRQINRYFNNRFGLSLKAYCTILKCFSAYKDLKKGKLYPEQHYFDQSHFIKELKKHTGNNPKTLFLNENDRFLQLTTLTEK